MKQFPPDVGDEEHVHHRVPVSGKLRRIPPGLGTEGHLKWYSNSVVDEQEEGRQLPGEELGAARQEQNFAGSMLVAGGGTMRLAEPRAARMKTLDLTWTSCSALPPLFAGG